MQTQPGATVLADRYRLDVLLGRSPTGMEWLAWDSVLDRRVVVTLVDPRLAVDPEVRERLAADARALAAVRGSTLVRLLDAGTDHDVPFAVTERVDGSTLAEILDRGDAVDARRTAEIVGGVLDGLAEAHAAGVLHLDPSPINVVVEADTGTIRLRGAGIRAATMAGVDGDADVVVPPEAPDVDERSDVWCAGALILRLATGRWPSDGRDGDVAMRGVPRWLRQVALRALAPDPADRFADAASMGRALRAAAPRRPDGPRDAAARSSDASAAGDAERAGVFRTWLAVPVVVAIVAAAVLAAGLWLGGLELGGRLGIRIHHDQGSPSAASTATAIPVRAISVIDPPPGDGRENDDALPAAIDGNDATAWRSENYFDGSMHKAGVGLVLDLGAERTVTGFRLDTPQPGFDFHVAVGDDPSSLIAEAEASPAYVAPDADRSLAPRTGRYVLVWITSVVAIGDGSNRAEVSEIRVLGS